MVRVGVLGATGYTALELFKLLHRHPEVECTLATSRQEGSPRLDSVHPRLRGLVDLPLEPLAPAEVAERADCVFSCLPHAASAETVKALVDLGARVIDFSADYRLNDVATYEQWYGNAHPDPDRVGAVPYGLPELFGDLLRDAPLVANPGCFPTGAILPLAPLLEAKMIAPDDIIVDSKTGVSGAGRTPKLAFHYPECNESITAYNVGRHRHTPEMNQILLRRTGVEVSVVFTPHLAPMDRGILSTIYCRPADESATAERALQLLQEFYERSSFVRVTDALPSTKATSHSNYCDITVRSAGNRLILISAIDNLVKGASGAAVQNFNRVYGFPEDTAL